MTKSFGASKNSEVAATYSFLWIGMRAKSGVELKEDKFEHRSHILLR
ncbi:MAG: hypothetical protein WBW34_02325 [Nitrososphaeraceae archaeon]